MLKKLNMDKYTKEQFGEYFPGEIQCPVCDDFPIADDGVCLDCWQEYKRPGQLLLC